MIGKDQLLVMKALSRFYGYVNLLLKVLLATNGEV